MKTSAYSPDKFFEGIYDTHAAPFADIASKEDCLQRCEDVKGKLREALAIDKIPYKTENLSLNILKSENRRNYTIRTVSVEICKDLKMLCYVLQPEKATENGIVAFCGHGYGCRQIIRQSKNGKYRKINFFDNYQKNFAEALAMQGHLVIVPEPIGFGEAKLQKDMWKPFYSSSCDTVSHHSLLYGFSAASLRVYQVIRCIDILTKLYGCRHIGCMGISGGGLVSLYSACIDERIEKTCVCGYINTFKTSVLSMWHCPDNYIPGLLGIGDMYDFASAIAPRHLMMEFGREDKLFPIEGSRFAAQNIASVYEKAGARYNFTPVEFGGKHEVFLPLAIEFFSQE